MSIPQPNKPQPFRFRVKGQKVHNCPFSDAEIKELNRIHDRRMADVPDWIVVAPAWLDKTVAYDAEDQQNARLDKYHKGIDSNRRHNRLAQESADRLRLQKLHDQAELRKAELAARIASGELPAPKIDHRLSKFRKPKNEPAKAQLLVDAQPNTNAPLCPPVNGQRSDNVERVADKPAGNRLDIPRNG